MIPWGDVFRLVMDSASQMWREPWLFVPLAAVLFLIRAQYRRIESIERALYGVPLYSMSQRLGPAALGGFLGGAGASVLFLALGIALPETGLAFVWLLALILMTIHPRFICFAYAGGIVALSSLIFGVPQVNVAGLMGLVAMLHLVEAVLIYFMGAQRPSPVFVHREGHGTVGGLMMQQFWPVPFFAVIGMWLPLGSGLIEGGVNMPDWWPLIGLAQPSGSGLEALYLLFPVAAGLGYGDVAVTSLPGKKATRTATHLLLYSVVLLGLAVLATKHTVWAFVAALFSPLAHEAVIYLGRRSERHGDPVFTARRGVVVLGTLPDSPARAMGLQAGDVVRSFNGIPIRTTADLEEAMHPWALQVECVVEDGATGEERIVCYKGKVPPLGVIAAPPPYEGRVMRLGGRGPLGRWLARRRSSSV